VNKFKDVYSDNYWIFITFSHYHRLEELQSYYNKLYNELYKKEFENSELSWRNEDQFTKKIRFFLCYHIQLAKRIDLLIDISMRLKKFEMNLFYDELFFK